MNTGVPVEWDCGQIVEIRPIIVVFTAVKQLLLYTVIKLTASSTRLFVNFPYTSEFLARKLNEVALCGSGIEKFAHEVTHHTLVGYSCSMHAGAVCTGCMPLRDLFLQLPLLGSQ